MASRRCSRSSFGITILCVENSRLTGKVRPFHECDAPSKRLRKTFANSTRVRGGTLSASYRRSVNPFIAMIPTHTFLLQDPILFTGTIASNIAFGNATATREEIEHAARLANCEFVRGMPKGFDTESELHFIPTARCLTFSLHHTRTQSAD